MAQTHAFVSGPLARLLVKELIAGHSSPSLVVVMEMGLFYFHVSFSENHRQMRVEVGHLVKMGDAVHCEHL